ncbi:MAG: response regulator [Sandaracinus sp.]|nr:response regulator [Sandaracinus sp.]MCB9625394.1 response regulator [Sandaracinus sp.]MCB9636226.1 response regulator [Sandaracinus sp.]
MTRIVQSSDEHLGALWRDLNAGVMCLAALRDADGNVVDFIWRAVNPYAERLVNQEASTLVGARLLEVFPGNAPSGLFAAYVSVVESGEPKTVEQYYPHDGFDRWFSVRATRDGDDGLLVVFTDVTSAKAATRDVHELLGHLGEACIVVDKTWRVRWINEKAQAAFGNLTSGLPVFEGLPLHLHVRLDEHGHRALQSGARETFRDRLGPLPIEVQLYPTDSGLLIFFADATAQEDERRSTEMLVTLGRCIERGMASGGLEASLSEAFTRLGTFVRLVWDESSGDGFDRWLVRTAADEREPARARVYRLGTHSPRPWGAPNTAGLADVCELAVFPLFGQVARGGLAIGRHDETDRFTPRQIEALEEAARRVTVALDLRSLLQVARQESDRARTAMRARDDFLAAVTHELRAPLGAILGAVSLLEGSSHQDRARAVEIVERSARTQLEMVEDLLAFAAPASEADARPLDLAEVCDHALRDNQADAAAARVTLESEVPRGSIVLGDDSVARALQQLLANAIRFSKPGETVRLVARRWQSSLRLTLEEHGLGLTSAELEGLFQPFRRRDRPSARVVGLGLGLAVARRDIEALGGRLWAESAGPEQGTSFVVELPIAPLRSDTGERPRVPAVLEGVQVLVVDDEEDARWIVAQLLEREGAFVRTVASASEARRELAAWRPDVLVSDLGMPGEDGLTFLSAWREDERGPRLPALAVTAYAAESDAARARAAGFDAHLGKPVSPKALVETIARLARG